MVGIISHNGLGLFDSSKDKLAEVHGQPTSLGQAKGGAYINIATGNLSIQFLDESLSGSGVDLFALRTYNSQGGLADGDADGWRWSGEKKVVLNSGTLGGVGSSVKRTLGDGSETIFNWDATKSIYVSKSGPGAHDIISWNAGTSEWIFKEDGSNLEERYFGNSSGWIKSLRDVSGNGFDYTFIGDKLSKLVDIRSGQTFEFAYGGNGKLSTLSTRTTLTGTLVGQVYYSYDGYNRLSTVKTDLSPDNSVTDNNVYTTTYTYEVLAGDPAPISYRIASIGQSDGSSASFLYDTSGRVTSVTDQTGTSTITYNSNSTAVKNGVGYTYTYTYDATSKQLLTVSSGAGQHSSYTYDAEGNVKTISNGTGNTVTYTYDANGNRTKEVDTLGNTVSRTFGSLNQALTETRYSVASVSAPSGAETVRYVYDSANRLRFVISAEGRVSETRYNGFGQLSDSIQYSDGLYTGGGVAEADLTAWVTALTGVQKSKSQRVSFEYDYRGNLSKKTAYATVNTSGAGVVDNAADITKYTYSEYGQLVQTIAVRGSARTTETTLTSVIYDGLGRQLSIVNEAGTTTTAYSGVTTTVTNTASGLTIVSTTDALGRVKDVRQTGDASNISGVSNIQNRITKYYYDGAGQLRMTEDPTGGRNYLFYDAAGRVSARVDANGAAIAYSYNKNNQVLTETRYSNTAVTTGWFNGTTVTEGGMDVGPAGTAGINIATDPANDRKTTYTYDVAGRVLTATTDGTTTITNSYDGASRLVQTVQGDRITKFYYDEDGRQIGLLNAERNFSETVYDAVGRVVKIVRYDGQVLDANQATGSFDIVKADVSANTKLLTYFYYDAEGRQVGVVNEQGFLTETVFDAANNQQKSIQYKAAVVVSEASDTLATLKSRAGANNTSITQFDDYGRVSTVTTTDGTVSRNEFDTAGRLIRQILADGTSDQRATRIRINAFSEITGTVSGVGEASLVASPTQAQIDTAINNYGVRYDIDGAGRKIAEYSANGQKTFLFYNTAGQLTYVVNALGEVSRTSYNSFGQVSEIRVYNNKLSPTDLALFTTGGFDSVIRTKAITSSSDNVVSSNYDKVGNLSTQTDAEGYQTVNGYNIFGELANQRKTINTSTATSVLNKWDRDKLGRVVWVERDIDTGGLKVVENQTNYDGLGRIKSVIDANGKTTTTVYTDNGRTITVTDPLGRTTKVELDAFGRTLNSVDGFGKVTTYTYDDVNRKFTVTSPENITITTWSTRTGETLQVQDGKGQLTTYIYTKDGQLDTVKNHANVVLTDNTYDNSGRLYESKDANGIVTRLTYDAANRVIEKSVDPTGLNLRTAYEFDGQGRQIYVIEGYGTADARKTQYIYDRKGQISQIVVDPDSLKLSTKFTYDGVGQTLKVERGTVTSPSQQITEYTFDKLGRKTQEILDAGAGKLNITTQYKYDLKGNLTRIIDANNNSAWFVYNNAGQKTHQIDAMGGVTLYEYDRTGKLHHTRQFLNVISTVGLGDVVSTVILPAADTSDRRSYLVYDDNGRLEYTLNAVSTTEWAVTQNVYDANGNVIEIWAYDKYFSGSNISTITGASSTEGALITAGEVASLIGGFGYSSTVSGNSRVTKFEYDVNNRKITEIVGAVSGGINSTTRFNYDAAGNLTRLIDANDKSTWFVYDKAGRLSRKIDALGTVTAYEYSNNGALHHTRQYASAITTSGLGNIVTSITLPAASTSDRRSYMVNDGAGRVKYTLTAATATEWVVSENSFDAFGNLVETRKYGKSITEANINTITASGSTAGTSVAATEVASLLTALGYSPTVTGNARVTKIEYDAANRKTAEIVDAVSGGINSTTRYKYDAVGNLTRRIDANNNSTWFVYDKASRVVRQIDALGSVTAFDYLANGTLHHTRRYATAISTGGFGDVVTSITLPAANSNDARSYNVADVAGRTKYTLLAANATEWIVGENTYDAFGNLVEVRAYDKAFTEANINSITAAGSTDGAFIDIAEVSSLLTSLGYSSTVTGNARVTKYEYDAVNRKTAEILDATTGGENIKTAFFYDNLGNLTRVIHVPTNSSTWYMYNELGQKIREIRESKALGESASSGEVTSFEYDAAGNIHHIRRYLNTVATSALGNIVSSLTMPAQSIEDRRSYTIYDRAGRLVYNLSARNATEWVVSENTYNAFGSVLSITAYDKTLSESQIASVTPSGTGKEITLSEVAGLIATIPGYTSTTKGDSRITSYQYDAMGRQIRTILPGWYDVSEGRVYATQGTETDRYQRTIDVKYDAMGNAVANIIRIGQGNTSENFIYKYKTYDALGREVHDIDGEGYVTQKIYNILGTVKSIARSANKFTTALPSRQYWLSSEVGDQVGRTLSFEYDRLGRQTKIIQPTTTTNYVDGVLGVALAAETTFLYNTFGNIKKQSIKIDSNSTSDTYYYFDKLGREIWNVGARGHATYSEYNSLGNLKRVTEFVTPLSGPSVVPTLNAFNNTDPENKNRITEYDYDLLGRIEVVRRRLNHQAGVIQVEKKQYNRFGDVAATTDALGNVTSLQYNRAGQMTSLIEPTRKVAQIYNAADSQTLNVFTRQIDASPITSFYYNTFGERTKVERSAGGGRGATIASQHIRDVAGNEIQTQDGNGNWQYSSFDVSGKVVRQTQAVSVADAVGNLNYSHTIERRFTYDKAGRQVSSVDIYGEQQSGQFNKFNGYGEVTEEYKIWGVAWSAPEGLASGENSNAIVNSYTYDAAGRFESKRSSDGFTYYYYDLMGKVTRMEQRGDTNETAGARIAETTYDALGYVIQQKLPGYNVTAMPGNSNTSFQIPILKQTTDRWGNVLTHTNAANKTTVYSYDQDNRVVSERGFAEEVLNLDLSKKSTLLEHKWIYDIGGRLVEDQYISWNASTPYGSTISNIVGTVPIGMHVTKNIYNQVGQLLDTTDASGVKQSFAYDAHGNRVGTKNALGYIVLDDFNASGKITNHSILRVNNNGTIGEYTGAQTGTLTAVSLATFKYDQVGRKYAEGNGLSQYQYYRFDERNNILIERTRAGVVTNNQYDELGHKISVTQEQLVNGVITPVLLNKWIYTVPGFNGYGTDFKAYNVDQLQHREVDGVGGGFHYVYDRFGQLVEENRGLISDSIQYEYWENGLQKAIKELKYEDIPVANMYTTPHIRDERNITTFYYDINGNKTASNTWQKFYRGQHTSYGGVFNPTIDEIGSVTTYYLYDNLNRLKQVSSPSGELYFPEAKFRQSTSEIANLTYSYDEWGNRRRISTMYKFSGDTNPVLPTKEEWFSYDEVGRVTIEGGQLVNGVVTANSSGGILYTYDDLGRRDSQQKYKRVALATYMKSFGNWVHEIFASDFLVTSFLFNDVGLVKESNETIIRRDRGADVFADAQDISVTNYWKSKPSSNVTTYNLMNEKNFYDIRGFKETVEQLAVSSPYSKNDPDPRKKILNTYTADGDLSKQVTKYFSFDDLGYRIESEVEYVYNPDGGVKSFVYKLHDKDKAPGTIKTTNTYTYRYLNTYLGKQLYSINVKSDLNNTGVGTTFNTYDIRGHLIMTRITETKVGDNSKTGDSYRYFNYDALGQIIVKAEKKYGISDYEVQSYYYSPTSGELANYGKKEINISPLSAVGSGGNTPGEYTVNSGDTLFGIAQALFGDSKLWYLIADANGLTMGPTEEFISEDDIGRILVIPNVDKNISNTSVNWKPYNATEMIGDLTPTVKIIPPKDKGCDVVAKIIGIIVQIIVTIIVTIVTLGNVKAGQAAGAAAGNYAQQYATLMLNGEFDWERFAKYTFIPMYGSLEDRLLMMADPLSPGAKGKIDYESIAISAAAGYIGGAASSYTAEAGKFISGFAGGAASYATNYGLNRLAGNKPSFSLKAMTTAAVAQGIIKQMGPATVPGEATGMTWGDFKWDEMCLEAANSVKSAAVNYAVGKVFDPKNTHWDTGLVLADAFGNGLGSGIVKANYAKAKSESDQPKVNEEDGIKPITDEVLEKLNRSFELDAEELGMDAFGNKMEASNDALRQNAERKNEEKSSAMNKAHEESARRAEGEYLEAAEIIVEELTPVVEEMTVTNQKNEADVKQIFETNYNSSNRQALAEAKVAWYNDSNRVEARQIGQYSAWRAPQIAEHEAIYGRGSGSAVVDTAKAAAGVTARFIVDTAAGSYDLLQLTNPLGLAVFTVTGETIGSKLSSYVETKVKENGPGMFTGMYLNDDAATGMAIGSLAMGGEVVEIAKFGAKIAKSGVGKVGGLFRREATTSERYLDSLTPSGSTVSHGEFSTAIGADETTLDVFNRAKNTGDGHNLIVHGSSPDYDAAGGVFLVDGNPTHTQQIVDALLSNPNYKPGSPVCLASCWSGSNGTAQEVSNALNATVTAPTRPVRFNVSTGNWEQMSDLLMMKRFPDLIHIQPEMKVFNPGN